MDRRRFVRAVGVAGAAGFAGAMGGAHASAEGPVARAVEASDQTPAGGATDFAKPANLPGWKVNGVKSRLVVST
jgi:hypothetical protein